jgi:hypothetical protein
MNTTSVILTSILTCVLGLGAALEAAQHPSAFTTDTHVSGGQAPAQ